MQEVLHVSEHRKQLQQEIPGLIDDTIAARILRGAGTWIQRVTRQSHPVPWYLSAFLLEVTAILPQTLIALVLRDPQPVINEIQEQIHALKNGSGLNSTAEIETLNKLMELYDRVYNARNTRLRITSILEFLNQLLLPLLAFLLSHYNAVLKLFNLAP